MRRAIALGLADAMLAGTKDAAGVLARVREATGLKAAWQERLVARALQVHGPRWHPQLRDALASWILETKAFQKFFVQDGSPKLRRYFVLEPRMSTPPPALSDCALPRLECFGDIASFLDLSRDELANYMRASQWRGKEGTEAAAHYRYVWIPKRSSGYRLLEMPKDKLKAVQKRLLHGLLEYIPVHEAVHGFRQRHSIVTHAALHVGQAVVLRLDLQDFFLNVGSGRVMRLLETLGFPRGAANVLTRLMTHAVPGECLTKRDARKHDFEQPQLDWRKRQRYRTAHLPQGAPTSPALANLCAFALDVRLQGLAEKFGCTYSRYADDLTFSGGKTFARGIERFKELVAVIALEEGFPINHRKTRVMTQSMPQRVTGVIVNERLNVPRAQYDELKAILHNCIRTGPSAQNRRAHYNFKASLAGRIAHVSQLNARRGEQLRTLFERVNW